MVEPTPLALHSGFIVATRVFLFPSSIFSHQTTKKSKAVIGPNLFQFATVGLLLLPHSHLLQSSFIFYLIFPSPIPIYCSLPKKPFHASPSSELKSSPHSKSHIVFHLPTTHILSLPTPNLSFFSLLPTA